MKAKHLEMVAAAYSPPSAVAAGSVDAGLSGTASEPCKVLTPIEYYALQPMEQLFSAGDHRDECYRIEAGAVLVSSPGTSGALDNYRVAGPGDYVGLGFLAEHTALAVAIGAVTVTSYTPDQLDACAETDPALKRQRAAAIEREFVSRRIAYTNEAKLATPTQKVARLLVALAGLAASEGRDLKVVSDALECDFAARFLGMDVATLASCVDELGESGLVMFDAGTGILLHDVEGLEALC